MPNQNVDEAAIFNLALKIPDSEARSDYIDQVCGDSTALKARVEALLESPAPTTSRRGVTGAMFTSVRGCRR